ncbi:MAG: hypothetical protein EOO89_29825, partial [Pedobacter sp.]
MTEYEENKGGAPSTDRQESINIGEIIAKYTFSWPVFVLGLILSLTIAFFYLRYTQEVYTVNGTLLIKDDKGRGAGPGDDLLNQLDLFGSSKVVDNEIEILKSKTLMRKVVDRLNLSLSYDVEGRLINSDIYSTKPVDIGVIQMNSAYYGKQLILRFPDRNSFSLEDQVGGRKMSGKFNQIYRTAFG